MSIPGFSDCSFAEVDTQHISILWCKYIHNMIQVASFLYLKMDYLSHGVKIPGQSVRTLGRLFVLRVNAAKASLFTNSL